MKNSRLTKFLIFVLILFLSAAGALADSFFLAPKRLNIRAESLVSEKIPESLNDFTIVYFSDLDYGKFTDEKRLDKIISSINETGADVVIFGGDIFEDSVSPDEQQKETVITAFKEIRAPYGKFAVYGDDDEKTEERKQLTDSIYAQTDFEVLNNTSISLHHGGSASITLVALGNDISSPASPESAYASVSANNYVLTVCHTPDSADLVPADLTDYMIAGHSHGGQVNFGFIAMETPEKAVNYLSGRHVIRESFTLDITSGAGTTGKDIRFMTGNEIVVYRLSHQTAETVQE